MTKRRPLVGSATALAVLGCLAAFASWRLGAPVGWLVAWFAGACFIIAAAYAVNWPGVFGKTTKAPARTLHQLVLLPFLAYTAELPKMASGATYLCLPILDAGVPDAASLVRAVTSVSSAKRVFIHCAQGHGRTALFAACVLIHRGYSAQAAIEAVLAARPGARMNGVQRAFVEDFAKQPRT